jgi:hypothetical protein
MMISLLTINALTSQTSQTTQTTQIKLKLTQITSSQSFESKTLKTRASFQFGGKKLRANDDVGEHPGGLVHYILKHLVTVVKNNSH